MPTIATLFAFTLLNMSLALIPGPDVICIVSNAMVRGRRAGMAVCLGIASACLLHVLFATLGLTTMLLATPWVYAGIKLAGALYLGWLGFGMARAPVATLTGTGIQQPRSPFAQGALTNLFNPKIALFFLAILPQFIDPIRGSAAVQSAVLGLICVGSGTAVNLVTAYTASRLSARLQAGLSLQHRFQQVSGCVLMVIAARLLFCKLG
ncbi:MAG: LysE family translocator [Burkholderiales bacterium]|nr:LysE family translocator [Burkholderiales bacterium]